MNEMNETDASCSISPGKLAYQLIFCATAFGTDSCWQQSGVVPCVHMNAFQHMLSTALLWCSGAGKHNTAGNVFWVKSLLSAGGGIIHLHFVNTPLQGSTFVRRFHGRKKHTPSTRVCSDFKSSLTASASATWMTSSPRNQDLAKQHCKL